MAAEDREVAEAERPRLLDEHRRRWRRGFEADGEKDYLTLRVPLRKGQCISARVDHPDVAANAGAAQRRFRLEQRQAARRRYAHRVTVTAQGNAGFANEANRHVYAADWQHANRTAGTVNHAHVTWQKIRNAVARDGVRVPAAELHEMIVAIAARVLPNGRRQTSGQVAVTELVDEPHLPACSLLGNRIS